MKPEMKNERNVNCQDDALLQGSCILHVYSGVQNTCIKRYPSESEYIVIRFIE